jgi:magnesium transporter
VQQPETRTEGENRIGQRVPDGTGQAAASEPGRAETRTRPARTVAVPRALNVRSVSYGSLTWIDIIHPGDAEIEWLRSHYHFHPLHLEDTLSKLQRPKIDDMDDYTFIVMHFPVYSKLVRLLYYIVDKLVDYCFPILNKIDANIEQVEDEIFEEKVRHTVQEISLIRRDVIAFRRIIKPLIPVINSLERKSRPFLNEDMDEYFGNISDHLSKIWDTLEDYKEVIEGLSDTINSLTSNRINEIIKVLTIISVILLPLTVISGIYGMNIPLPVSNHPLAFEIVMGLMAAVIVAMLGFFKWKKWI